MACIIKDQNGTRRIQFYDCDGKRKQIRLGKCPQKLAEAIKVKVEALITAMAANQPVDAETAKWVSSLNPAMSKKLAGVGLASQRHNTTLGCLLKVFDGRNDVKPGTKVVWGQARKNLIEFFGENKKLHEITPAQAEDFRQYLIGQGLASWTIHKRLQFSRMAFRTAIRRGLVLANPFAEVTHKKSTTTERQYFVSREAMTRLLAACNLNWQVILGLSRFGGLRCPSEVLSLRWVDIKWDTNRFVVWSPKTEHFEGKDHRIVPLFPELRVILERAYEVAQKEGYEYVVNGGYLKAAMGPRGWMNANLRTQFQKIIKRAGLTPWPRLFHNMRASRETELVAQFPVQVVTAWLGNTPAIAMRHYLQVRDSDFEAAVQGTGTSLVLPPPVPAPALYDGDTDGRQNSPKELLSCISLATAPHLAPPDVKYPVFPEEFARVSNPVGVTNTLEFPVNSRVFHLDSTKSSTVDARNIRTCAIVPFLPSVEPREARKRFRWPAPPPPIATGPPLPGPHWGSCLTYSDSPSGRLF